MGTIAENLLALQQTKENFKTAFAEKGVDVSNTPFTEYPNKVLEIQTGGGTGGEYFVKVIDYDGTVLKETRLNTGDTFTLPTPPSHDGLVFKEWSCSQDIVDNVITITDNNVMAGPIYTTVSGLNEFDIELNKATGLDVTLNMDGTKDWGDGTSDELTTHTYTTHGNYTIKCDGTLITASSSSGIFGQSSSIKNGYCVEARLNNVNAVTSYTFQYCSGLLRVLIANSVSTYLNTHTFANCFSLNVLIVPTHITTLRDNLCVGCYSLEKVVIPNSVVTIEKSVFQTNYKLKDVVIPNSVTRIENSAFQYTSISEIIISSIRETLSNCFINCKQLKTVKLLNTIVQIGTNSFSACDTLTTINLPDSLTTLQNYAFSQCRELSNIKLPKNLTTIGNSVFSNCTSLIEIDIPSGVTNIAGSTFENCYNLIKYDFSQHTSIPTLSALTAFSNINPSAKIIVPDALYDEWIVATNWVSLANHIYKASEV